MSEASTELPKIANAPNAAQTNFVIDFMVLPFIMPIPNFQVDELFHTSIFHI